MNADIEVKFYFNDNRKPIEGYRPSHLLDGKNLTTGVHHYYTTKGPEAKGTIEFIAPEYFPKCLTVGSIVDMYDGSNKIGFIEILKIFNPILEK
ncbi:MAG: hypothetical protein IKP88_04985 [Lachnospiraceae bacterium]|nr:hypothetical protein [Lachnospiraceae bacterium]